jgi:hypothetical protein
MDFQPVLNAYDALIQALRDTRGKGATPEAVELLTKHHDHATSAREDIAEAAKAETTKGR